MNRIEEKIVFCAASTNDGPVLMVGLPEGAWEYMKDGKTHTLDLSAIGWPVKLMLYGGKDHAACLKVIEDAAKAAGAPIRDDRRKDYGYHPQPKPGIQLKDRDR